MCSWSIILGHAPGAYAHEAAAPGAKFRAKISQKYTDALSEVSRGVQGLDNEPSNTNHEILAVYIYLITF